MSEQDDAVRDLAEGLWRRVRDIILVAERVEDFAFRPGEPPEAKLSLGDPDAAALAGDVVSRAFRAAGAEPAILEHAAREGGTTLAELASMLAVPTIAVAERVNELVQAGLVVRQLDGDRVEATQAGAAIAAIATGAAGALAAHIRRSRGSETRDGLPLL